MCSADRLSAGPDPTGYSVSEPNVRRKAIRLMREWRKSQESTCETPYLRVLFGNVTEYMPKREAVKQVARITEVRCDVLQFISRYSR